MAWGFAYFWAFLSFMTLFTRDQDICIMSVDSEYYGIYKARGKEK